MARGAGEGPGSLAGVAIVFTPAPGSHCLLFCGEQGLPHPCVPFQVTNRGEAHLELNAFRRKHDCALVISGDSLEVGAGTSPGGPSQERAPSCGRGGARPWPTHPPRRPPQVCLKYYECEFMELACQCPAVVCCRCAPTQKAQIVRLLQERTGKLTCAVGRWPPGPVPVACCIRFPYGRSDLAAVFFGLPSLPYSGRDVLPTQTWLSFCYNYYFDYFPLRWSR